MQISVFIGMRRRRGQHYLNAGGQVAGAGSGDLRSTFGVELEVFAFRHRHAFQAGHNFLLDAVRRCDFVEQDS